MATDATGGTTLAKAEISSGGTVPIGFLKTAGSALLNPFVDGDYDAWLFPTAAEADANDTTNAIQIADNLNADPNNALVGQFEAWQSTTTYAINEIVLATNGSYYISLVNSNLNFEPSISPTQWQLIPVKDMASTESDTFTTPTLTSAVLNTSVTGTAVLDEDDMVTDSATQLATQQSIKAYVDSKSALGTPQATTSGTQKDFTVPSWATKITVSFSKVSCDTGSKPMFVRLGDSGGIETTGYDSCVSFAAGGAINISNSTTRFGLQTVSASASGEYSGKVTLTLLDSATNLWAASFNLCDAINTSVCSGAGSKALSAELTTVRFAVTSAAIFDNGTVNIRYE